MNSKINSKFLYDVLIDGKSCSLIAEIPNKPVDYVESFCFEDGKPLFGYGFFDKEGEKAHWRFYQIIFSTIGPNEQQLFREKIFIK